MPSSITEKEFVNLLEERARRLDYSERYVNLFLPKAEKILRAVNSASLHNQGIVSRGTGDTIYAKLEWFSVKDGKRKNITIDLIGGGYVHITLTPDVRAFDDEIRRLPKNVARLTRERQEKYQKVWGETPHTPKWEDRVMAIIAKNARRIC